MMYLSYKPIIYLSYNTLQSSETYYYKVHVLRKLSMKNQGNGNYKEVLKYDIENSLKN